MRVGWIAGAAGSALASLFAFTALIGPLADRARSMLGWGSAAGAVLLVLVSSLLPPLWVASRWLRARARAGKETDRAPLVAGLVIGHNVLALLGLLYFAPAGTLAGSRVLWLPRQLTADASRPSSASRAFPDAVEPRKLWEREGPGKATARDTYSSHTAELAFASSKPGFREAELLAIEVRTGDIRWRAEPPEPTDSWPEPSERPFFRHASVTVLNEWVVFQYADLSPLRAAVVAHGPDGRERWTFDTTDRDCTWMPMRTARSIAVGPCGRSLLAIDVAKRQKVWQVKLEQSAFGSIASDDARAYWLEEPMQHAGRRQSRVVAVDLTTGAPAWSVDLGDVDARALLVEGERIAVIGREAVGLSTGTGAVAWRRERPKLDPGVLRPAMGYRWKGLFLWPAGDGYEGVEIATGLPKRAWRAPAVADPDRWSLDLVPGERDRLVGWLERSGPIEEAYLVLYDTDRSVLVHAPGGVKSLVALTEDFLVMSVVEGATPPRHKLVGYALR